MRYIELSKGWRFRAADESKWKPASVPGCVHLDLLDSGVIEDPFSGDNHERMQWISEREWVYECRFYAPKIKADEKAHLCCSGLDTLASIELNGEMVGNADNMFRSWRFDISTLINEGDNILTVHFASPVEYIKNRQSERFLGDSFGNAPIPGRGWLRKMSNAFGTYWNPPLVTAGIWRAIGIEIFDHPRIDNITVQQHRCETGEVRLKISAKIEGFTVRHKQLNISARISCRTTIVCEARQPLKKNGVVTFEHTISNPQLWWPNGLGSQPLYEIVVEITAARKTLHSAARRIGLRTLTLERKADKDGESFQFTVNGVPFFAKGSTWMPPDVLLCRPTRLEYAHFIKSVSSSNMNMLRVWGGGIYEQDWFYDLCDEHGICVWQDFMFASAAYPTSHEGWLRTTIAEIEENIVRLHHHPCIALWCGNGMINGIASGGNPSQEGDPERDRRFFEEKLSALVKRLSPSHDYWPSAPVAFGVNDTIPAGLSGDAHYWGVGSGLAPIHNYRQVIFRFCSAFGLQSYPQPSTIGSYTGGDTPDLDTASGRYRQLYPRGDEIIKAYTKAYFPPPKDREATVWLSQIQQGYAARMAVEHWRRNRPRCMGAFYWHLNDSWPAVSWSSLEYNGNWKALHYFARRFFAPIIVSAVENASNGTLEVFINNDLRASFSGRLEWRIGDTTGRVIKESGCPVEVEPGEVRKIGVLKMGDLLENVGAENLVIWLRLLSEEGQRVASNVATFKSPGEMRTTRPEIACEIKTRSARSYQVTLTAKQPAFWCWLEVAGTNARFDDNFIHLPTAQPFSIKITPVKPMDADAFRRSLVIRSFWDLFNGASALP